MWGQSPTRSWDLPGANRDSRGTWEKLRTQDERQFEHSQRPARVWADEIGSRGSPQCINTSCSFIVDAGFGRPNAGANHEGQCQRRGIRGGYTKVTTSDGSGKLPPKIQLPTDATTVVFAIIGGSKTKGRCTHPCVTVNGGGNYNDADGIGSASGENVSPDQSISGIQTPNAGFVAGVFESGPPNGAPPATLNFNTIGTNFSSLSPLIQQLFFVGDGLTGDGTGDVQVFYVPSGAKYLYLGLADACGYNGTPSCYGDNSGNFVVSYAISTASGSPEITHFSPTSGKVGSTVKIWGYNLLTASAVTFNGVPASFKVGSTLIGAVVPAGATTGPIEVTTPDGTAQSKGEFTVKP